MLQIPSLFKNAFYPVSQLHQMSCFIKSYLSSNQSNLSQTSLHPSESVRFLCPLGCAVEFHQITDQLLSIKICEVPMCVVAEVSISCCTLQKSSVPVLLQTKLASSKLLAVEMSFCSCKQFLLSITLPSCQSC